MALGNPARFTPRRGFFFRPRALRNQAVRFRVGGGRMVALPPRSGRPRPRPTGTPGPAGAFSSPSSTYVNEARSGLRENRDVRTDPWRSPALQPPPCRTLSPVSRNSPLETGGPSLGARRCYYSPDFRFALLCSKGIHRPLDIPLSIPNLEQMRNRRIFWAAAMRDLQQAHPPAGVHEERLRAVAGLRGVFDLTSWRGRSGRRYVVGVQPITESDAAEVSEGVLIAVRCDAERVARLVDVVAAEPAFRAAERKAWAARMRDHRAVVADLSGEPDLAALTAPPRDTPEPGR